MTEQSDSQFPGSRPPVSLAGVFPPIPTPFDAQGEIAYGALADNLARWNQYALSGYVVLGSNGEAVYVDEDEKVRVWEVARRTIPTGKLMIAGSGAHSTRATIALTRKAADAGADAALLVTPHYYAGKMTADALVRHYCAVADGSPIPVMVYNVPGFTQVNMEAAAVARAAQHPNIIGIKDTAGNIAQLADTIRLAGAGFQLLAGSASFFFAGLALGAVGGILALANVAPQACIDIYRLYRAGRWDEAAVLQRRMLPVNAAVTARFGIAGLKAALDFLGYYGGPVRAPLLDLGEADRQTLRSILSEGGVLSAGN
jgi:4-hydroxy-2-oxoglutarate aldolase